MASPLYVYGRHMACLNYIFTRLSVQHLSLSEIIEEHSAITNNWRGNRTVLHAPILRVYSLVEGIQCLGGYMISCCTSCYFYILSTNISMLVGHVHGVYE